MIGFSESCPLKFMIRLEQRMIIVGAKGSIPVAGTEHKIVDVELRRERGDVRRRRERLHTRQVIEIGIDRFRPISIR